jgi:nucleoside-diphosphate-sugar epimerase
MEDFMPDKERDVVSPVTAAGPAFVAGATGYTGRALVAELRRMGHDVVAHVRPDSERLEEWRRRFDLEGARVSTAAWQDDAMTAELASIRPRAVYALLGTTRSRMRRHGRSSNSYEAVDYGLTALLLRACLRAVPDTRFIYLSSMGVGPRARGQYLQVRWRMEEELRRSGISHRIVRPAFITGSDREESRPAERIAATAIDGVLKVAGLLGAKELQERYRSRTAEELAGSLLVGG